MVVNFVKKDVRFRRSPIADDVPPNADGRLSSAKTRCAGRRLVIDAHATTLIAVTICVGRKPARETRAPRRGERHRVVVRVSGCRGGRAEKSRIQEQPYRAKVGIARTSFVVNLVCVVPARVNVASIVVVANGIFTQHFWRGSAGLWHLVAAVSFG